MPRLLGSAGVPGQCQGCQARLTTPLPSTTTSGTKIGILFLRGPSLKPNQFLIVPWVMGANSFDEKDPSSTIPALDSVRRRTPRETKTLFAYNRSLNAKNITHGRARKDRKPPQFGFILYKAFLIRSDLASSNNVPCPQVP